MGNFFLWAFFFIAALPPSFAQDGQINTGGPTYVPPQAANDPAVRAALQQSGVQQNGPTPITVPTPETIPAPSTTQGTSLGQYRNSRNEVKLDKMFLDRYKQSVVRVTARDLAGNKLAEAMGVGIGRGLQNSARYIATPLSIVLGNEQQWADIIEIKHHSGNSYTARVALIDEEKNLVLLAPEATPAAIPFVRPLDERPQIDIYTIGFRDAGPLAEPEAAESGIQPTIHKGTLAAANQENGVLSVSGSGIDDSQAGTAIINSAGELIGMLLPGGRGVLSSALELLILKADKATPFTPSLIGAILGRGVLVSPTIDGAYRSISAALDAVKKGEAPKADPTRYFAAKRRDLAPKESTKTVIKVMPGTYRETKPLSIPSDISLSGSGPGSTTIFGNHPERPVLLVQNAQNVMVTGFRIVPAPLQKMKAPTVIVSKSGNVTLLGNIVEAKGGVALWAHESRSVSITGNTFPRGEARAVSCDRSVVTLESNAFLGDWPMALSADRNCTAEVRRNLFLDNKTAIAVSALASKLVVQRNSFIRDTIAIKVTGTRPSLTIDDNLFFESQFALQASSDFDVKRIGRNAVWRSKFVARGRELRPTDVIRTEPDFENPANFDFRIKPGKGQLGVAARESGADLGAFQRQDFLGGATQHLVRALAAATGESDLPEIWGL